MHLIGVDYFGHIAVIYLRRSPTVNDTALAQVERFTQLEVLGLWETSISDAGLAHLEGLTKLTHLSLFSTRTSDARLTHLTGLTNLTRLDLNTTQITAYPVDD